MCSMEYGLLVTCILGGIRCGEGVWKVSVGGVGVWKGRYCNAPKGHVDIEPRKGMLILSPEREC